MSADFLVESAEMVEENLANITDKPNDTWHVDQTDTTKGNAQTTEENPQRVDQSIVSENPQQVDEALSDTIEIIEDIELEVVFKTLIYSIIYSINVC